MKTRSLVCCLFLMAIALPAFGAEEAGGDAAPPATPAEDKKADVKVERPDGKETAVKKTAKAPDLEIIVSTNILTTDKHRADYEKALYQMAASCFPGLKVAKGGRDDKTPPAQYRFVVEHKGSIWFDDELEFSKEVGLLSRLLGKEGEKMSPRDLSRGKRWTWTLNARQSGTINCLFLERQGDKYRILQSWDVPFEGEDIRVEVDRGVERGAGGTPRCKVTMAQARTLALPRIRPWSFVNETRNHLVSVRSLRARTDRAGRRVTVAVQVTNRSPWPLEELSARVEWAQHYSRGLRWRPEYKTAAVACWYRFDFVLEESLSGGEERVLKFEEIIGDEGPAGSLEAVEVERRFKGIPREWPEEPQVTLGHIKFSPRAEGE